jgi:opacity protein-like surface antigen
MKKLLTALCLTCALTIAAQAEDATQTKKKHSAKAPTPEQKAAQKEILEKYDTNKDGKLDKAEKSKISTEDKAKMEKAGMGRKKKGGEKPEDAAK